MNKYIVIFLSFFSMHILCMEHTPNTLSLIWDAARKNCMTLVQTLLLENPIMETVHNGKSPVGIACQSGSFDIARKLLDSGYSANVGNDPAFFCALEGNAPLEFFCDLISTYRTKINQPNSQGIFPLFAALNHKRYDVFQLLIDEKADCGVVDADGNSLWHVIMMNRDMRSLQYALDSLDPDRTDVKIFSLNAQGETPFSIAAFNGDITIISFLKQTYELSYTHYFETVLDNLLSQFKKNSLSVSSYSLDEIAQAYNRCLVCYLLIDWVSENEVEKEILEAYKKMVDQFVASLSQRQEMVEKEEQLAARSNQDFEVFEYVDDDQTYEIKTEQKQGEIIVVDGSEIDDSSFSLDPIKKDT